MTKQNKQTFKCGLSWETNQIGEQNWSLKQKQDLKELAKSSVSQANRTIITSESVQFQRTFKQTEQKIEIVSRWKKKINNFPCQTDWKNTNTTQSTVTNRTN